MTAIERTAYPRFKKNHYRKNDLQIYLPSDAEREYLWNNDIRSDKMRLNFMLQLKTFQQLGYFPNIHAIPKTIVRTIRQALGTPRAVKLGYQHADTKYRHRRLIRELLGIDENNKSRDQLIMQLAEIAAQTMNDPANIINVILEALVKERYELPAFSAIDRTVCNIRHKINDNIFNVIRGRIDHADKTILLLKTLEKKATEHKSPYHQFKRLPQKPTVTHFKELVAHHDWLMTFGDFSKYLTDISKIKLEQFAEEARALPANAVKEMCHQDKKIALIACLLAQAQCRTKDALAQTFDQTVHSAEKEAIRHYTTLDKSENELIESIAELLFDITTDYQDKKRGKDNLRKLFAKHYEHYGGADKVIQDCEKLLQKGNNKHYPFIWKYYRTKRTGIFAFLQSVQLAGIKKEQPLLHALKIVEEIRKNKRHKEWVELNKKVDLSFAPKDWLPLIAKQDRKTIHAHYFELCVMMQLREKLRTSDVYIQGADAYGDYRKVLMPWSECEPLLNEFCSMTGIENSAKKMVAGLKKKLKEKSKTVDKLYPELKELVIDHKGVPTLKKRPTKKNPGAKRLRDEIKKRMPERNLLDIMCLAQNCTGWAHYFSPLSGSNAKLAHPIAANIVTTFGYGTGMGPSETARHVRAGFNARTIGSVNKSHVTLKKLNTALAKIVDYYQGFPLVKAWGTGDTVIVDGTLRHIYEENLLAETHIRYGAKGGIAYHHISDTYIALFSSLISCGTWEAISIIEGLLRNESKVKPTKVHGDTQAQSTPVFSLAYLFGIHLMPRIRNWKDLIFYKADKRMKFKNINSLFKDTVNWTLIENYWQDMMQVVLSIQHGKISSDLILSKLNSRNKSSQLYKAFRELGNVIRTLFLLDFISKPELRETITAQTNKVESFNNLSDWIRFASETIVASNDTTEMEKAIKYNTLLTNMVILQNVIDMSRIIQQLRIEGWSICREDLAGLSPYLTEHLKRFGDFILDLNQSDGNIEKIRAKPLFA